MSLSKYARVNQINAVADTYLMESIRRNNSARFVESATTLLGKTIIINESTKFGNTLDTFKMLCVVRVCEVGKVQFNDEYTAISEGFLDRIKSSVADAKSWVDKKASSVANWMGGNTDDTAGVPGNSVAPSANQLQIDNIKEIREYLINIRNGILEYADSLTGEYRDMKRHMLDYNSNANTGTASRAASTVMTDGVFGKAFDNTLQVPSNMREVGDKLRQLAKAGNAPTSKSNFDVKTDTLALITQLMAVSKGDLTKVIANLFATPITASQVEKHAGKDVVNSAAFGEKYDTYYLLLHLVALQFMPYVVKSMVSHYTDTGDTELAAYYNGLLNIINKFNDDQTSIFRVFTQPSIADAKTYVPTAAPVGNTYTPGPATSRDVQ